VFLSSVRKLDFVLSGELVRLRSTCNLLFFLLVSSFEFVSIINKI
jgi:hypothetical protein